MNGVIAAEEAEIAVPEVAEVVNFEDSGIESDVNVAEVIDPVLGGNEDAEAAADADAECEEEADGEDGGDDDAEAAIAFDAAELAAAELAVIG